MRVGIVIGFDAKSGGGFQHQIAIIENLKEYASNCGHEFYIFSHKFLFDTAKLKCAHIKFIEVGNQSFLPKLAKNPLKIARGFFSRLNQLEDPINTAVNKYEIDLMYYSGGYDYCSIINLPYILTVWDLQHRLQPEFPEVGKINEWRHRENLCKEAIGRAYAIIVDETAGKEDVIRFYSIRDEKVFVLPFIPSTVYRLNESDLKTVREKYKLESEYIFYPAQFWPHKNHVAILEAIKNLKEEYNTNISVVFTGSDKGNLSHIKKLTNHLNLTNQIFFLGFVPDEDIPALYKGALALVMPTYFGPSNIPVYEAFAYRCPVISSDIRGIREQVGDSGILVEPSNFKGLSEAILNIHRDDALRNKLIDKGIKRNASWTGQDYIENLIKIIDNFSSIRLCWGSKNK